MDFCKFKASLVYKVNFKLCLKTRKLDSILKIQKKNEGKRKKEKEKQHKLPDEERAYFTLN